MKSSFLVSAGLFILALVIRNCWICELTISFTALHALSTIVLIGIFQLLSSRLWLWLSLVLLLAQTTFIMSTYYHSSPLEAAGDGEVITIAQYNCFYENDRLEDIARWLQENAQEFDIVSLHEVSHRFKEHLVGLEKYYPYRVINVSEYELGHVFLSRLPITSNEMKTFESIRGRYFVFKVKTYQAKPLHFYVVHPLAPLSPNYLKWRNAEFAEISTIINQDSENYKILSGDFNATPYSHTFAELLNNTNLQRARVWIGSWPTILPLTFARIQIDHSLISQKMRFISQVTGPDLGSDHMPVITKVALQN